MTDSTPPGWYPAGNSLGLRWWDGSAWTSFVVTPVKPARVLRWMIPSGISLLILATLAYWPIAAGIAFISSSSSTYCNDKTISRVDELAAGIRTPPSAVATTESKAACSDSTDDVASDIENHGWTLDQTSQWAVNLPDRVLFQRTDSGKKYWAEVFRSDTLGPVALLVTAGNAPY